MSEILWPKNGEQLEKKLVGPLDQQALVRYAQASGDDNPLHLDPSIAAQAGLEAPPIHGMLIVGQFEPMLFAWRPDFVLSALSTKFLRPVLVGQAFELSGRVIRVTPGQKDGVLLRLMAYGISADGSREMALVAEAKLTARGLFTGDGRVAEGT